jgi:hypothetical protein
MFDINKFVNSKKCENTFIAKKPANRLLRNVSIFFHPDYTVGTGIAPVQILIPKTPEVVENGIQFCGLYRRWGLASVKPMLTPP